MGMQALVRLDRQLFFSINHLPHHPITDSLALFLSGVGAFGLVWLILSLVLFLREEHRNHRFFIPVLAGLSFSLISERALKHVFSRMRPDIWPGVLVIGSVPPSYAFPSGHATVAFAMAMVLSDAEPGFRGGFYLLAFGIAFSRVYLGVHYPLDVIAGSLLGTAIGWLILRYFRFRRVSSGRQKKSAIHR